METDAYAKFFEDFMQESDRAALVLGAAQMDALLEDILRKRLIEPKSDLFGHNGAFGTFSARIEATHATGVIDKEFANRLNLVRKIRNSYAHEIGAVDLEGTSVSQQIAELAKAFSSTDFWSTKLAQAGEIYKKGGNSLTLRFAIALLVANLAMIARTVGQIDASTARPVFCPST
jgi:hypothetical protein